VDRLARLKVITLRDLLALPESALLKAVGKFAYTLLEYAKGKDDSPVVSHTDAKSISSEETSKRIQMTLKCSGKCSSCRPRKWADG